MIVLPSLPSNQTIKMSQGDWSTDLLATDTSNFYLTYGDVTKGFVFDSKTGFTKLVVKEAGKIVDQVAKQ